MPGSLRDRHGAIALEPTQVATEPEDRQDGTFEDGETSARLVPSSQAADPVAVSARLQILSTEHWSLLATRSLTWNESFSRSSIFLATVSGTVIALALAAQATSFGPGFFAFALVVLPVTFFIGLATFLRLVAANREDVLWVQGMNRIRHAYLELAPELEPYFVAAWHDDEAGVLTTLGASPRAHGWHHHVFATTPGVVAIVDAMVGANVAALAALAYGMPFHQSIAVGIAAFASLSAALLLYQRRTIWPSSLPTVRFPRAVGAYAHRAPHRVG